jgi:hypothetical protein
VLDIREMLRRLQLGQGDRAIARDLRTSRKTVAKYRPWAEAQGLLRGPLIRKLVSLSGRARGTESPPAHGPARSPRRRQDPQWSATA